MTEFNKVGEELPQEYQELANIMAKSFAKRHRIDEATYKVHLVSYPKDCVIIKSGRRVDITTGFDIMSDKFAETLERAIKRVPLSVQRYALVRRGEVLVLENGRSKFMRRAGDIDLLLPMALPKERLSYTVRTTKEITAHDIATGHSTKVIAIIENENTTEEEMIFRARIQLGAMCGYGDPLADA